MTDWKLSAKEKKNPKGKNTASLGEGEGKGLFFASVKCTNAWSLIPPGLG